MCPQVDRSVVSAAARCPISLSSLATHTTKMEASQAPAEHFSLESQWARMGLQGGGDANTVKDAREPQSAEALKVLGHGQGRLLGALQIEVLRVEGLPPHPSGYTSVVHRHWTPFVVVTFGSNTHRTKTGTTTDASPTTAVLDAAIPSFELRESEIGWDLNFAVYDKPPVGFNYQLGLDLHVDAGELVEGTDQKEWKDQGTYYEVEAGEFSVDDKKLHDALVPGTRFPLPKEKVLEVPQKIVVGNDMSVEKQAPLKLVVKVGFIPRFQLIRNLLLTGLTSLHHHPGSKSAPEVIKSVTATDAIFLEHLELGPFYLADGNNGPLDVLFKDRDQVPLDDFVSAWDSADWEPRAVPGGVVAGVGHEAARSGKHSADAKPQEKPTCTFCGKPFPPPDPASFLPYPVQMRDHLLLCASRTPGERKADFADRGYVTEDGASYGSYSWMASSLLSRLGFGTYKVGSVEGHILVRNRRTGLLEEEYIPSYVRLGIQLLYRNRVSRTAAETAIVEGLLKRASVAHGVAYDNPASKADIPSFVQTYSIDLDELPKPLTEYTTMNDFFTRQLKPGVRVLEGADDPNVISSAADCRISAFNDTSSATTIWIKGSGFSIARLLGDNDAALTFEGGAVAIFRLSPQDYHRWHMPVSGTITGFKPIRQPGLYYTVNPMAIRSPVDVFGDNVRDVCYVDTGRPDMGTVAVVAVGAMMVGSIVWTVSQGQTAKRFDEMGYFKFGGSTVVVLFPKGAVEFDADLLESSGRALESVIRVGDKIGKVVGK